MPEFSQFSAAIDLTAGFGVAGHSMGGQASLFSASYANASDHGIKASVMMHPYSHEIPSTDIPTLTFTGTHDATAHAAWAMEMFEAGDPSVTNGFANLKGEAHSGCLETSSRISLYTAAWMKLFVTGVKEEGGVNFEDLIFANNTRSLCGGGYGKMEACELNDRR